MSKTCTWSQEEYDESDSFNTDCGHSFIVIEGTPGDNDMKFCCYCGNPIETIVFPVDFGDDE